MTRHTKPSIHVSHWAWYKFMSWAGRAAPSECAALFKYELRDGIFHVNDFFMPPQECTSGNACIDEDWMRDWLLGDGEHADVWKDVGRPRGQAPFTPFGHIHTHPNSVFYSATDEDLYRTWANMAPLLAIVTRAGDYDASAAIARMDIWTPHVLEPKVMIDDCTLQSIDCDLQVLDPNYSAHTDAWAKEYDDNFKRQQVTARKPSQSNLNDYVWLDDIPQRYSRPDSTDTIDTITDSGNVHYVIDMSEVADANDSIPVRLYVKGHTGNYITHYYDKAQNIPKHILSPDQRKTVDILHQLCEEWSMEGVMGYKTYSSAKWTWSPETYATLTEAAKEYEQKQTVKTKTKAKAAHSKSTSKPRRNRKGRFIRKGGK